MNKTYIKRDNYINQIKNYFGKDLVKVMIGQRRVGKSYILIQIIDELKKNFNITDNEIIYINKEDIKWDSIRNYSDLYEVIKDYKYIFIDEIQDILEWEKAIRSLQSSGFHDIYITGSNSNLLSSELSTFLSGRYVSFYIYPLNYKEFLKFHNLDSNQTNFLKYISFGGLPYLKNLELKEDVVYPYLRDIINTIILKDVVSRNNLRNIDFYKKLITYLSNNVGSIFSAKSISDYLKSQKVNISPNIVLNYIDFSINASFLNKVQRYDIKGKRLFEIRDKFFFTDIGIKNALIGGYSKLHISGILENIVYCNLVSNGWDVKIGEIGNLEVDFLCEKGNEKMYVQVAYLLETEDTKKREFASLLAINDSYKKYVVTTDLEASGNIEGVEWINIINFLEKI